MFRARNFAKNDIFAEPLRRKMRWRYGRETIMPKSVRTLAKSFERTLAESHWLFFSVAVIWALIYVGLGVVGH
jgi:hypothetical protein